MAWSKHGFRPIRARVIYMLFYNGISSHFGELGFGRFVILSKY
jgi:hypothetical protein